MEKIIELFNKFIEENNLNTKLSFDMPKGYESAYGTYDVSKDTLFFNLDMIDIHKEYEAIYYLYHELRHAYQYNYPYRFSDEIMGSLPYVILYNGQCFKLVNNKWLSCKLEGKEEYFTNAYLSLPYEIDANYWAKEKVLSLFPQNVADIELLHTRFVPKKLIGIGELLELFNKINNNL